MMDLLRTLGIATAKDTLATAGTIVALLAIVGGVALGMVAVAAVAGVL